MYHSVDRLITTRQRMVPVQSQLNACYRSLVDCIMDGQIPFEDIVFVRNMLYMDIHNQELCRLYHKLDKALQHLDIDTSVTGNDDMPLS